VRVALMAMVACCTGAIADTALLYLLYRLGYEKGRGYIGYIHVESLRELIAPTVIDVVTLAGYTIAVVLLRRGRASGRVLAWVVGIGNVPVRGLCCYAVWSYASSSGTSDVQPVADYSRVWVTAGGTVVFFGLVASLVALSHPSASAWLVRTAGQRVADRSATPG